MPQLEQSQEDEINLKGFVDILVESRLLVIITTTIFVVISGVYAYTQTPVYEATALVKIGSYKTKKNQVVEIESVANLVKILQTKHLVIENTNKNKIDPKIVSILAPKKTSGFIEFKAEAVSNELAVSELSRVVSDLINRHSMVIKDHRSEITVELDHLKSKIKSIESQEKSLLQNRINESIISLKSLIKDKAHVEKGIDQIEETNPVLALVKYADKQILSTEIFKIHSELGQLRENKIKLTTDILYKKFEDKKVMELLLMPYNIKNTQIIGGITTYDYPIRPMSKLIMVVGSIAGFLFSIFVVFTRRIFKEQ